MGDRSQSNVRGCWREGPRHAEGVGDVEGTQGGDATGRSWGDTLRRHHVGEGAHGSMMGTGRGTSFHGGSWREAAIGPGG